MLSKTDIGKSSSRLPTEESELEAIKTGAGRRGLCHLPTLRAEASGTSLVRVFIRIKIELLTQARTNAQ
jgi:hypothetical protein